MVRRQILRIDVVLLLLHYYVREEDFLKYIVGSSCIPFGAKNPFNKRQEDFGWRIFGCSPRVFF